MITIKAAVAESKGARFEIAELELDEPRPDEVLVRMVACGICQTDSHAWHQHLPVPLPAVLGHEGAGVVESIGSTVTSVAPGDHVVLSYQACGRCPQCLSGHYPYCDRAGEANFGGARLDGTNGVHRHRGADIAGDLHGHFFGQSSFATYALTTERNTVRCRTGNQVRGIIQGDAIPQLFIPQLIELYKAGQFPFDRLIRHFPFEEINEAFAAAASGDVIKPVLRIAHNQNTT